MSEERSVSTLRWYRTRNGQILLVMGGFAALYFLMEYGASLTEYLPWLLLAACPLLHVFMHRGHGGHGNHSGHGKEAPPLQAAPEAELPDRPSNDQLPRG